MKVWIAAASVLLISACGKADFGGSSNTKKDETKAAAEPPATETKTGPETATPTDTTTETATETDPPAEDPADPCKPKNDRSITGLTAALDQTTGVLTLSGDASANTWTIVGTEVDAEVSVKESAGATPVIFICAKSLHVIGNAGDDVFELGGIKGLTKVTVDGNDGNDTITLLQVGNAGGTQLVMNGGAGNDTMSVSGGSGWGGILANGD